MKTRIPRPAPPTVQAPLQPVLEAPDRPAPSNVRALLLLGLAFFVFSTTDALAKFLTQSLPPPQVTWMRHLGLGAAAFVILARRGPSILSTNRRGRQLIRGSVAALSSLCFIVGVSHVPIADAVSVTFVAPFLVAILGVLFLKERVTPERWVAVGLGFVGALIVIRPGFGVFHPAIFLVLLAATLFSVRQVMSRALASERTETTLVYTALTSLGILTLPLPFVWVTPSEPGLLLIALGLAVTAAIGEILLIRAFEIGEAVVIAPMHYSIMIWATFWGWLLFDQLPDGWTWAGTGIIFATGLFLIGRERQAMRRARRAAG